MFWSARSDNSPRPNHDKEIPPTEERALESVKTARKLKLPYVAASLVAFLCLTVTQSASFGQSSPVQFSTDLAGIDEEAGTLLVALPIINSGTATASKVEVRSIALTSAALITPAAFPLVLGDIAVNERAIVEASFTSSGLVRDQRYLLTIQGTYSAEGKKLGFAVNQFISLPAAAPGEKELKTASVESNEEALRGEPIPQVIIGPEEAEANPPGPPTPTSPPRDPVTPDISPSSELLENGNVLNSGLGGVSLFRQRHDATPVIRVQATRPAAVRLVRNTQFGLSGFTPPDPSGASSGRVVLASGNTYLSVSIDGGSTFPTTVNFTNFFSDSPDGGLCCDQIVHYVPSIDRFVWLLQYNRARRPSDKPGAKPTGPNRLRLMVASPQAIINNIGNLRAAWTLWDLTSATFGLGNNWMDYPDLAFGNNFLHLSVDVVGKGLMVVEIPLVELQRGPGRINLGYTDPEGVAYGSHVMQNAGDEVFWAGHRSNSKMRIFSSREGSDRYSWRDINIRSWPNRDYTSNAPGGFNWLAKTFPGDGVIGATRRISGGREELIFAWMAGTLRIEFSGFLPRPIRDFRQPHIQAVRIDRSSFRVLDQFAIWNPNFAFAYPALATNANNEVGASVAMGGPTLFPTHAVGMVEDGQYFRTSTSNGAWARYGDYYTVRPHFPNSKLFSAFGYGILLVNPSMTACGGTPGPENALGPNCQFDPHYVLFGRASDVSTGVDLVPPAACNFVGSTLTVTIANQGDTDAPTTSTTTVEFLPGGTFALPTPSVPAAGTVDLSLTIPSGCFVGSSCVFRITVDANKEIVESNEVNNTAERRCQLIE